jgi:hypothetical protein
MGCLVSDRRDVIADRGSLTDAVLRSRYLTRILTSGISSRLNGDSLTGSVRLKPQSSLRRSCSFLLNRARTSTTRSLLACTSRLQTSRLTLRYVGRTWRDHRVRYGDYLWQIQYGERDKANAKASDSAHADKSAIGLSSASSKRDFLSILPKAVTRNGVLPKLCRSEDGYCQPHTVYRLRRQCHAARSNRRLAEE